MINQFLTPLGIVNSNSTRQILVGGVVLNQQGSQTYNIAADGGVVCSGIADAAKVQEINSSGGCLVGGEASSIKTIPVVGFGGALVSGTSPDTVVQSVTASGGALVSGASFAIVSVPRPYMGCKVYSLTASSGGVVCSGSATISVETVEGGVVCGGSAIVDIPTQVYYGCLAVWPLSETSSPYEDLSPFGNDLSSSYEPVQVEGLNFDYANQFQGDDYLTGSISLTNEFTVTGWLRIDAETQQPIIELGDLVISATFLNHIWAYIDDSSVTSSRLETGLWYSFAVTVNQTEIGLFVDGQPVSAYANTTVVSATQIRVASLSTISLQEIRIYDSVLSESAIEAIHLNWCDPEFYVLSVDEAA